MLTTIFFVIVFALSTNVSAQDNMKRWSKEFPITIDDFKGLPSEVETRYPKGVFNDIPAAYLATSISFETRYATNYWEVSVMNEMDRNLSFVNDTTVKYWLQHEQIHFNINEVYARKIRRAVEILQKRNERNIDAYNKVIDLKLNKLDSV
ncbi:hypothetical protein [Alkalitalea saponilacus]|uniref:DUF922 domain-containing protein n=2 Tax=Alkalitalea saponilacus TaxID=889453 RepID=A0A1T5AP99_9BACT|nr:hypothetical protein [Alkalitalea saponilacus]ASB48641.1 hypothetical protein CDL62_05540 [Alkalitalea saponilacus]SKB36679.1 hypothetical protein SAMN03080601_00332 [Alkalitalea saponilacus]